MKILDFVLGIIITGIFAFLMLASIIIPQFAGTFETGTGSASCLKDNSCTGRTSIRNDYCLSAGTGDLGNTTCANCNETAGYPTFLSKCYSLIYNASEGGNNFNKTACIACTSFAGYKTAITGLMLFVFFILVIAIILIIVLKIMPKFA